MASQFLRSACRPLLFAVPLCASYSVLQTRISSPIRCDYASGPLHPSVSEFTLKHGGPSSQQKTLFGGLITAETARQISLGSALGVLTGLGLRIFLRTLAFSIGLAIIIIEWAASKGYDILPTSWLQRHIKSVDFRKMTHENVPFKASFGTTLAMAAFGEL
ncbi:hypothetical protein H112_00645 [Trichophyton rubrum D6]|nr:uncharacterized protein TERG_07767 [Trichophyton rubrum CBS 118892]EZF27348.1 hypothetical protein H100_00645 [Trichophyton rubrum MR850]EZF46390.1 hypothetical protein H102_00642 [Trichophyton rubrum CBS 100081]EZF57012.1 hypothetical protein H103_00644 [Trichophyton rubrum CBS 288.86]EZF67645.1 hypothetical protein H104_00631 [Trichophyton rubrum CBS 289.86]EZF88945.1 hypothetical protein H110_00649 [Trichophyton rubrum MR1448]EZF99751.1 hypothetical protein H113_00648 [Trichophyton rubr